MKEHLNPLLSALAHNTSLTHIDFCQNRIGDEGMKLFAASLKVNKTLTSFNGENNKLSNHYHTQCTHARPPALGWWVLTSLLLPLPPPSTAMAGLRLLHEAVMANTALTDWTIPMHDIEKVFKKANVKDVREMRGFIRDFETQMDSNEHKKNPAQERFDEKKEMKMGAVSVQEMNTDDLDNQMYVSLRHHSPPRSPL
jgi:hypothetical protein